MTDGVELASWVLLYSADPAEIPTPRFIVESERESVLNRLREYGLVRDPLTNQDIPVRFWAFARIVDAGTIERPVGPKLVGS